MRKIVLAEVDTFRQSTHGKKLTVPIQTMMLGLFILTLVISVAAHLYLKRVYARHSQTPLLSGYTGAEVAQEILSRAGIHDVQILEHEELLGDHYDPLRKRLVLSSANYRGTSAAALGVAAHECGHALQHKQGYVPLQLRMAAVGVTGFASQLVMWVPLLGIFTGFLAPYTGLMIMAVAWGILMAFNLVTLPVEFDASGRAKLMLSEMGFLQAGSERAAVSKVLNAAALTYVAAFITSLLYFLWYLMPLLTGRDEE